mgnify:CR=1 FL=1
MEATSPTLWYTSPIISDINKSLHLLELMVAKLQGELIKANERIEDQNNTIENLEIKINYIATETEQKLSRTEYRIEGEINRLEGEINSIEYT